MSELEKFNYLLQTQGKDFGSLSPTEQLGLYYTKHYGNPPVDKMRVANASAWFSTILEKKEQKENDDSRNKGFTKWFHLE